MSANRLTNMPGVYSQALEAQMAMLHHLTKQTQTGDILRLGTGHMYKGDKKHFWPAVEGHINLLETATPYYWASEICEVLEKAAPMLGVWRMTPKDFPSSAGFVHFARPMHMPMPERRPDWAPPTMDMVAFGWKRIPPGNDEYLITTYLQTSIRASGEMGMTVTLKEGESLQTWLRYLLDARRNPADVPEDHLTEHNRIMEERLELQARYIASALNFLNTPLMTTRSRGTAARATRKRLEYERVAYIPEIEVIELRRRHYVDAKRDAAEGDDRSYEAHVRFMVGWADGGFWNTYHTKDGPIERWIMPFMKRAERTDLPFKKPHVKIAAVVR